MPINESPLSIRPSPDDMFPRQPQREIAELLATAIVRARVKGVIATEATPEWGRLRKRNLKHAKPLPVRAGA